MDEHRLHAERIGHQAGVLAAGAAEAGQCIVGHVMAALHRDLLDGVGHVANCDLDEALGHRFRCGPAARCCANLIRQRCEACAHGVEVERLVAAFAEQAREVLRLDLAKHDVAVGDRQRAAAAVAGGPRIGAGAVRADAVAGAVEVQDRAAAGGYRVDAHHRRAHAHTGDLGLEHALELAGKMRDVGRGAAHVEADHALEAGQPAGAHHADDAAGGAGQDAILALEGACIGQTTAGLHELQIHARQLAGHLVDVAAQDGRQVGVHHSRVAARHQLHEGADLVRHGHLGEADLARDTACRRLVLRVAVAVHEDDGDRTQAAPEGLLESGAGGGFIQRLDDLAMRPHALVDFDHLAIQQFGQHDVAVEQARPVLVGDAQRVAEAPGDCQHGGLALAFEQRVGGDRRAHLDGFHLRHRYRLILRDAQQVANAGHGRVAVLFGVLGQQLVGEQLPVGPARHDVGEGAAAIDPELVQPPCRRNQNTYCSPAARLFWRKCMTIESWTITCTASRSCAKSNAPPLRNSNPEA